MDVSGDGVGLGLVRVDRRQEHTNVRACRRQRGGREDKAEVSLAVARWASEACLERGVVWAVGVYQIVQFEHLARSLCEVCADRSWLSVGIEGARSLGVVPLSSDELASEERESLGSVEVETNHRLELRWHVINVPRAPVEHVRAGLVDNHWRIEGGGEVHGLDEWTLVHVQHVDGHLVRSYCTSNWIRDGVMERSVGGIPVVVVSEEGYLSESVLR